ncbi:unnamed protein product, partial [Discosporangium mesarthrocarpum]
YGALFEGAVDFMFRECGLTQAHRFLDISCGIGIIVLQAAVFAGCKAVVRCHLSSWNV